MEFTTEYKSENYYAGRILSSNTYGDYKILGKSVNIMQGERARYVIEFLLTGTVKEVESYKMNNGEISDPMKPTVYGVGFMGLIKHL